MAKLVELARRLSEHTYESILLYYDRMEKLRMRGEYHEKKRETLEDKVGRMRVICRQMGLLLKNGLECMNLYRAILGLTQQASAPVGKVILEKLYQTLLARDKILATHPDPSRLFYANSAPPDGNRNGKQSRPWMGIGGASFRLG